ncbi:MAG: radical SAM protein [Phycisphaerae bacterium]|nr:radical SAM protein [Phycisphaerae bacterium]
MQRYTFGPVPSRRLGRSLGVDLVPFKTCSYDCLYCQLGRTTNKTTERRAWVPTDAVLAELDRLLPAIANACDYVTLSGSGEPTLHSDAGRIIAHVKQHTDIPVAVLTNGSLLDRPELRDELAGADLVVPSLDAGGAAMFRAVNRPAEEVAFETMLDGLVQFADDFDGRLWLEVFLLAGYNALPDEVRAIADAAGRIAPARVQLNTVCRPPAEEYARGVTREALDELAGLFEPAAEVAAEFHGPSAEGAFAPGREDILNMLRRRPCSLADIAAATGKHRNEVIKYIEQLQADGEVASSRSGNVTYYAATQ